MQLSHRDFRPSGRSKYVASPPGKKPVLRILLFIALAAFIYLKFDALVAKARYLRHPGQLFASMTGRRVAAASAEDLDKALPGGQPWRWSADSTAAEWECRSASWEMCLAAHGTTAREEAGAIRSLITKMNIRLGNPPLTGFSARFKKPAPAGFPDMNAKASLDLIRLEVKTATQTWVVSARDGQPGAPVYCTTQGQCLEGPKPAPPFPRSRHWIPKSDSSGFSLDFLSLQGKAFRPILPGKVLELPSTSDPGKKWVKLYHGKNIFSYYRNFAGLKSGLNPGDFLKAGDTLGYAGAEGDSLENLNVRIEKDGSWTDPIAFLGLVENEEPAHAP